MLESIRRWNLGIKIILGFVILTFVVFYAGSFAGLDKNDPSKHVAAVGEEKIGNVEYQNMFELLKRQQSQFTQGRDIPPQMYDFIRDQALNSLIERKLLLVEAKKAGVRASKEEIRKMIRESPYFLENGEFVGMPEYQRIVDTVFRMDIEAFETMLAEDVIVSKYNDMLAGTALVTDREVEEEYRKNHLTAKIDYVLFNKAPLVAEVQPTTEELRQYYESHKSDFETGELRKARYLLIKHDSEKNRVQIPESKLREEYEKNKEQYSRPEEVHARHILLSTQGKDEGEVKKQAEELVKQLRSGADFTALAAQYSDDPGSKNNGGDLGFFSRGRMVPPFEQVAFSQDLNQISDPVLTQFGYHIIQTLEKRDAYTMDFALVKDQIYRQLSLPQTIKNAQEQAQKLYDEITRSKKKMEDVAKVSLVEMKTTEFFARSEDLPGLSPTFRDKVFELKNKDDVSEPVQVFQDYAVIQLVDTRASEVPPFEKIEAKVTVEYRDWKAAEMAREKAQAFSGSLKPDTDFHAAAEKAGLTVTTAESFTKGGYVEGLGVEPGVGDAAFAMTAGEISKPVKANQGYVVFQLKEKMEFEPSEFAKQKDGIRQQLISQKQSSFLQAYRSMLRKKYEKEIWINEQMVKPLSQEEA